MSRRIAIAMWLAGVALLLITLALMIQNAQADPGPVIFQLFALFESGVIQTPRNPLYLKNGLQFRSKEKPARFAADKKRFFADAVTSEDQAFEFRIPDREAEHPAKALEKLEAFFFIEMDQPTTRCLPKLMSFLPQSATRSAIREALA